MQRSRRGTLAASVLALAFGCSGAARTDCEADEPIEILVDEYARYYDKDVEGFVRMSGDEKSKLVFDDGTELHVEIPRWPLPAAERAFIRMEFRSCCGYPYSEILLIVWAVDAQDNLRGVERIMWSGSHFLAADAGGLSYETKESGDDFNDCGASFAELDLVVRDGSAVHELPQHCQVTVGDLEIIHAESYSTDETRLSCHDQPQTMSRGAIINHGIEL